MSERSAPAPSADADLRLLAQADAALLLIDATTGRVLHSNPVLAEWLGQPLPPQPLWEWPAWAGPGPGGQALTAPGLRSLLTLAALGLPLQGVACAAQPPVGPALALRLWLKALPNTQPRQLLCTLVREVEGSSAGPARPELYALLATLIAALERHDPASLGHQRRVADLAGALAQRLRWPPAEVQAVVLAAWLHDVGMVTVPAQVLAQRSWLSPEQLQQIQQHVDAGVQMLAHIDLGVAFVPLVAQHHERLDGSGYPAGISGPALLRGAQVIGMADMLDAMTRERPYQRAQSLREALQTLREGAGVLFEVSLVQACLDLFEHDGYRFPEA